MGCPFGKKGQVSTPDDPFDSKIMLWIRDVALRHESADCLIWPFARDTTGYGSFGREGRKHHANRYICEWVHGAPPTPKHLAAHSCDNGPGGCVNPKHLSWKTNSENQFDRHRGSTPWRKYKLTPEQADEIRALRGQEPTHATAQRYGISEAHARHIQTGYARPKGKPRFHQFTETEILAIRWGGRRTAELAAEYGVSSSTIVRIRSGETYGHVRPHPMTDTHATPEGEQPK